MMELFIEKLTASTEVVREERFAGIKSGWKTVVNYALKVRRVTLELTGFVGECRPEMIPSKYNTTKAYKVVERITL